MARHGKHALITSVAQLKARCTIDPATHCWLWAGATTGVHGVPAIWCFDHGRGEKRTMSGPLAAWNIAHGEAPPAGTLVFRGCCRTLCLNPAHLRRARSKAEIGQHQRRAGSRRGTAVESRRANIIKAWEVAGIVPTKPEVVRAIRNTPPSVTGQALAKQFGLSQTTVSRIRRGQSHKGVA